MDDIVGVETTGENGVAVVTFKTTSVSDVEGIAGASSQIKQYIDEHQPSGLIFDFEGVRFFSSQVLGLLLDIRAKLKERDGQVVISAINPQLHRVFKITNLDQIFKFFPDRARAVEGMKTD